MGLEFAKLRSDEPYIAGTTMDNPENDVKVDFEERSAWSRAYSSVAKAIGEMAIISVAVSGAFRIFSKEFSMGESIKAVWTGPTSWLTYAMVGLNAGWNYRRESRQDKAAMKEHIENAIRKRQLDDAGLHAANVISIEPYGTQPQSPSPSQPVAAPKADEPLRSELAHTQQALNDMSHELTLVTNHSAGLKTPAETHAEQAAIAKAAAEQATATIH